MSGRLLNCPVDEAALVAERSLGLRMPSFNQSMPIIDKIMPIKFIQYDDDIWEMLCQAQFDGVT